MTYAPSGRTIYDADSHIMELPDFLKKYADPGLREQIPEVSYSASIVTDEEVAVIVGQGGRHSAEHVAAQVALGDKIDIGLQGDPGPGRVRQRRSGHGPGYAGLSQAAGLRHPQRRHAVLGQL